MKVIINTCYGGFGLSPKALKYVADKLGEPIYFFKATAEGYIPITMEEASTCFNARAFKTPNPSNEMSNEDYNKYAWHHHDEERTNPVLIEAVETLGPEANGLFSELKIVEVPDDVKWHIAEHDGWEWVAENHRKWGG